MKLYKIENEKEIWYFTTKTKCSRYLGCSIQNIDAVLEGRGHRARGYTVEIIEDDYVMSKFIDPEKHDEEERIVLLGKLNEAIKILINNDKRIKELENRIEELNKNIN
jgi:DNA-binding transcriptional MerR regulator